MKFLCSGVLSCMNIKIVYIRSRLHTHTPVYACMCIGISNYIMAAERLFGVVFWSVKSILICSSGRYV
jgi:hypothetical protein